MTKPILKTRMFRAWSNIAVFSVFVAFGSGCGASALKQQEVIKKEASASELERKGDAYARIGDMTRAEQYLVASLKAGGNEKRIVGRLLVVCAADQRYVVALEYAEQYLHHHPEDDDVRFAAASLHAAVGDSARARGILEDLVRVHPTWAEAHYVLAGVLRDQGEPRELADIHDLEYLKAKPDGPLSESARARVSRRTP